MNKKQKKRLVRILITVFIMTGFYFIPVTGCLRLIMYLVPYVIIGYDILKKAALGIKNRQVFDENFLMAVATLGAIVLAVTGDGDYTEAIAVMLFYQVGELFQSYAVGKSRRNICELMDIRPDYANVEVNGGIIQVDPDEVETGTVIVIRPGEKVPIDGVVVEGASSLNAAALTGESVPRDISVGDEVSSGCINMTGLLKVRTSKLFGESTVSKILDLVENASLRKAKSEHFISKFAKIYTPVVCYGALMLAVFVPLIRVLVMGSSPMWEKWVYRAFTFLVISCPCALVISIPLTFFAGIGGAGKAGILIKGANYLETLSRTRYVVMDKTGTLTKGEFAVKEIHHNMLSEEKLLYYAAHAESASSHPISRSIVAAYGREIEYDKVTDIKETGGQGIVAMVDGIQVAVGNDKLMQQLEIAYEVCTVEGTPVHIVIDDVYAGYIVISDIVKESSHKSIKAMKKLGIQKIMMLTGDMDNVAREVAKSLNIDEFYSELLPQDKVNQVDKIMAQKEKEHKLVFIGDGINDAPVLTRADVGIAMGALGSDAAIEAADVVLMDDDPFKIVVAIRHSQKCMRIVFQNIVFALGVKGICLILGAMGIANMWLAIFADVGVMVIAVLNAIRALFVNKE